MNYKIENGKVLRIETQLKVIKEQEKENQYKSNKYIWNYLKNKINKEIRPQ